MSKYEVNAFTLVEVLVNLVITAIVLSIVFVIFSIMSERMMDYKNQNEPVSEMNRTTYAINKDIFENDRMELVDGQLHFQGYDGSKTAYIFSEKYFLRTREDFIDTFHIPVRNIKIDSVFSAGRRKIFRKLVLSTEVNANPTDLKFYQKVSASQMLNR